MLARARVVLFDGVARAAPRSTSRSTCRTLELRRDVATLMIGESSHRPSQTACTDGCRLHRPLVTLLWAVPLLLVGGCHHLVSPPVPSTLPSDESQLFPPDERRLVRLTNGYETEEIVWFRSEGLHALGADQREWTEHVLRLLERELMRRGVEVVLGVAGSRSPPRAAGSLQIQVTHIEPPTRETRTGAKLVATVASDDGKLLREFQSVDDTSFRAALYDLQRTILADTALRAWIRELRSPHDQHDSRAHARR